MSRRSPEEVDDGIDQAIEAKEWMNTADFNKVTPRPTSPVWIQRWQGLVTFIQRIDKPWVWLAFPSWLPAAILAVLVIIVRDLVQREKKMSKYK